EDWLDRVVAESAADLPDAVVQALIELDEGRPIPDGVTEFLARHDVAGALDQDGEHAKRLWLEPDAAATAEQQRRARIQFEVPEAQASGARIHREVLRVISLPRRVAC